MKRKIIKILVLFVLIINISALGTILYNSGWIFPVDEETEFTSIIKEQFGINEAQAAEVKSIRNNFETEVINTEKLLFEKRRDLMDHIRKSNPDMNAVNSLIDEIGLLQTRLQKEAVKRMIQEKSCLNPAQQQRYISKFMMHLRHRPPRMGRGLMRRGRMQGRGFMPDREKY